MRTTWIAAAALALAAIAPPATAQVQNDAKAILNESARAIAGAKGLTFNVKTFATDILKDIIDVSGEVKLWRPPGATAFAWRVDGRAKDPGKPARTLRVVSNGGIVQWYDDRTNTLFIRPASDSAALENVNICRELIFPEWNSATPFSTEMIDLSILEKIDITSVGGEVCDQVRALTNNRNRTWAISVRDRLPRRLELGTGNAPQKISKITELSELKAAEFTAVDFDLKSSLPSTILIDEPKPIPAAPAPKNGNTTLLAPAGLKVAPPVTTSDVSPRSLPMPVAAQNTDAPQDHTPAVASIPAANAPDPPLTPTSRFSPALDRAPEARFVSDRTLMPLDPTRPVRVIPVIVPADSESDRLASAHSDDPTILAIERPARILPGQTIGYLLVRPLHAGETTLHLGDSSILIQVTPARAAATERAFDAAPQLLTPTAGAAVWGPMQIGAACWRIPIEPANTTPTIKLRIGDGPTLTTVEPVWSSKPEDGPLMLCAFAADFSKQPPGPCPLRLIRTDASGVTHPGELSMVQVVSPSESTFVQGECEADYGLMGTNVMGPPKPPAATNDPTASGGKFFNNAAADPKFRFPLTVPSELGAGWYQVILTAAGDAACSALPSIGITIDEAQRPITASAIASPDWHRISVGTPVRIEPGFHSIRCDFINDFAARGTDRNLRLDKIEIARVADSQSSGASGGTRKSDSPDSMSTMAAMAAQPAPGESMMSMAGSGGGGGGGSGAWPASARAGSRPPLKIAFDKPLDGQPIAGELEIRATLWWEDQRTTPPPQVALIINGHESQRHRSDAPRFVVPPETFRAGENTIQLRAITDSGLIAQTAPQRLTLPADLALTAAADHPRLSRRFTVYDNVWSPSIDKSLKDNQGGDQRKSASIAQSSVLALNLPDDLAGEFDVWVESHANGRNERRIELMLAEGAEIDAVGPPRFVVGCTVPSWFDAHRATADGGPALSLTQGPKRLLLCVPVSDGSWSPGKGDKNSLWIQGVRLVERAATAALPARVALDYPADKQETCGADALVATVSGRYALDWAEAIIDSKPTGLRFDIRHPMGGVGRVIIPLSLRNVSPGEHTVELQVRDMWGGIGHSSARTIHVSSSPPPDGTIYDRAITLLDRFAYGPDSRELADVLVLGPEQYLESRLDRAAGSPRSAAATGAGDLSDEAAQDLAAVKLPNPRSGYDVPRRAIQQAIATGNPVRNRFTLWAENHFSTWVRKDEAWRKWDEHERFSALGIARFYDLLAASATSPAMLRYLDQERSYSGKLNENYAREIMELHTLGVHGGYTQQDVTNLAHVLTGWTTVRVATASLPEATSDDFELAEDFRFDPVLGENLSEFRDVVGYRFAPVAKESRHQRVLLALEILNAHPSTATFVCTKLANHYVGVPPPPELITDLASVFTRSGGDMKEVLFALARHPAFWKAARANAAGGGRLSHPTDYAFRLARTAGGGSGWMNPQEIGNFLDSSGRGLFERATPDGYPELDTESMDSNAILQRWKLASKCDYALADGLPPNIRWSNDPINADLRQTIVDIIAIRLTGRVLGESSNTQALHVLEESQPTLPAKPDDLSRDIQIKTVATFIAQLPEANVR